MGMTIEDSIDLFEDNFTAINTHGHYTEEEEIQATEIAIDTMRKYQKIKAIMNELNGDFYGSYLKDRQTLEKIWEVMDNGNDD